MAKIPKNLRKSLQPSKNAGGRGGGRGGPRQMRRMMDQLGIDMKEVPALEVIIKCEEYDIVISEPQVSLINQAGQDIYQVLGNAEKVTSGQSPEVQLSDMPLDMEAEIGVESPSGPLPFGPQFTPEDIKLVAIQAGVTEEAAEAALKQSNGNIAQAIIDLRSNQ